MIYLDFQSHVPGFPTNAENVGEALQNLMVIVVVGAPKKGLVARLLVAFGSKIDENAVINIG